MKLNIITIGKTSSVLCPYNPEFVRKAKNLGGKWHKPYWQFSSLDEPRVRELCKKLYGSDGVTCDQVTLKIEWLAERVCEPHASKMVREGRTIFSDHAGGHLGDGVVLLEGDISIEGGRITVEAGTVCLIREFPRASADKAVLSMEKIPPAELRVRYSIVEEAEEEAAARAAMVAERAALAARMAALDKILNQEPAGEDLQEAPCQPKIAG